MKQLVPSGYCSDGTGVLRYKKNRKSQNKGSDPRLHWRLQRMGLLSSMAYVDAQPAWVNLEHPGKMQCWQKAPVLLAKVPTGNTAQKRDTSHSLWSSSYSLVLLKEKTDIENIIRGKTVQKEPFLGMHGTIHVPCWRTTEESMRTND